MNSSCFFQPLIHLLSVLNKTHPVRWGFPSFSCIGRRLFLPMNSSNSAASF